MRIFILAVAVIVLVAVGGRGQTADGLYDGLNQEKIIFPGGNRDSDEEWYAIGNFSDEPDSTFSLLDLFYGMDCTDGGVYYDEVLDTIKGLLHKEFLAEWRNVEENICFNMSIGLYLDCEFSSLAAKRIMLEKVDSALTAGMYYDLPENERSSLKSQKIIIPDSIPQFLDLWEKNFNHWTDVNNGSSPSIDFKIPDSRGCVVCHRIYEDSRWVTYILETSVSYHGSNGCPSSADYVTIDKSNGHILSKNDILSDVCIQEIYRMLPIEYFKAAKAIGFTPSATSDGEALFRQSDGVALINEGLLIYFYPYTIGCGAEGQYNIICDLRDYL